MALGIQDALFRTYRIWSLNFSGLGNNTIHKKG